MPPDIFLSTIFFDFRSVAGSAYLAEDLRTSVLKRAGKYHNFLKYFLKYFLLNEPPVTFYADSVVEKDDTKVEVPGSKNKDPDSLCGISAHHVSATRDQRN